MEYDETDEYDEPGQYHIVLLDNDHSYPPLIDGILANIFNCNLDDLFRLGDELIKKGRITVGTFDWDIAVSKARDALKSANQYGYPLQCTLIGEDGSSHEVTYTAKKDINPSSDPNTKKYNTY